MANEIAKTSKQTKEAVEGMGLGLTDLIAGMIQATVDADQAVTDDYMQTFREYAFEKDPKGGNDRLQMVDFEMVDNEGVRRLVSIPKLSLLPLPVLHVSEATFDIDAKIKATAKEETETEALDDAAAVSARKDNQRRVAGASGRLLSAAQYRVVFESELNKKLPKTKSGKTKSGGESQSIINAKIHIELRPTTLSGGMRDALQVVDSSVREMVIEDKS